MTDVTVIKTNENIAVRSPYHPRFPKRARNLGGSWDGTQWTFDVRDEDRVRALCLDIYGTDGSPLDPGEVVTLRVTYSAQDSTTRCEAYVAGRQVARAFSRDGGARLGEGIIVIEGGFYSTGSRKNPALGVKEGTVIEVRDVPRAAAENGGSLGAAIEVLEAPPVDEPAELDREALQLERMKLKSRIAEIDELLGE